MKVALIGSGKTGSKVLELLDGIATVEVFNLENVVTVEKLQSCDVAICFIPAEAMMGISELLLSSKIPVVTGSTGMEFPDELNKSLIENKVKWIHGHNFALGMNLIYEMIKILKNADKLFDTVDFKIHEVHHTKKLDAPSGTAISWENWLGHKADITSDRIGDVIGDHKLTVQTDSEQIILEHSSLDRRIFAKGAIWGANKVLSDDSIPFGITRFEDLARKELQI